MMKNKEAAMRDYYDCPYDPTPGLSPAAKGRNVQSVAGLKVGDG